MKIADRLKVTLAASEQTNVTAVHVRSGLDNNENLLSSFSMRLIRRLIITGCLLFMTTLPTGCSTILPAEDRFTLTYSPFMYHFKPRKDHNNYPNFVSVEWDRDRRLDLGAGYFNNSYDQPSAYLYAYKRWNYGDSDQHFYSKVTAGALLGYVGKHEDRIPVNWNGFGLGVIPTVGYQYRRVSTQVVLLGISAFMLTAGYDF